MSRNPSVALEPQKKVAGLATHHQARFGTLTPDDSLQRSARAYLLSDPRLVRETAAERDHLTKVGYVRPLKDPQLAESRTDRA